MKFYYINNMGDEGVFQESNLVKAIYTAWNIEAELWLLNDDVKKLKLNEVFQHGKLIFSPHDDNKFNSEILEEYGYKMIDGDKYREIVNVNTGQIERYDWSEVKQLF